MEHEFDIQSYMTAGVERIVADALRATVKNPRESAYMLKFASEGTGGSAACCSGKQDRRSS